MYLLSCMHSLQKQSKMKKYKSIIILINLVLLLFFFNKSLLHKEETLANGKLVLLELAPVDPRSLMQGDYMRLNYDISRNIDLDSISKRGYCVVTLNDKNIAQRVRFQDGLRPKNDGEYFINYTSASWRNVNIGAESYFFQEGQGEKFEKAKYGGLKIDNKGKSILVGLYDKNLQLIE